MSEFDNIEYNRGKAVAYANEWALKRNPQYYDFSNVGGDCTNFASQCLFAGCGVMNYKKTYGWYYISSSNRAPAWSSVKYFHRFLLSNDSKGPYGRNVEMNEIEIGDIVQIKFSGSTEYKHTPVIVDISGDKTLDNILVAAHSFDCNDRALSTYNNVSEIRFIHISGARY